MTCDQADLRMAELLCGEIAAEDRGALEKHLLECETCREDYEAARVGARIECADVPVPAELIESTRAAFREPGRGVRFLRAATAAAAVFCVAALLLTSSRRQPPVEPAPMACQAERPERLASMQDAIVGALVCTDESGRPVGELGLQSHSVSVEIQDGIAKTTVEENFENHTDKRLEGQFQFPLPPDASISRLALEVNGKIEEGTCLERERAREVFESIVSRMKDPALLEWQPGGFFKCRIFPIEPRATKRVIVAYTQALPYFRGKMTYVYPLVSEKTRTHPPETLSLDVVARFNGTLTKIESPSHHLEVRRKNASEASLSYRATRYRPNNDFVVALEPAEEEVRVVSHKPDGEDGYFACFVTPRGVGDRTPGLYTFVVDASASVSAPRLDVAKRLVRAMLERRIEGDHFEILAHNVDVEASGEVDLRRANDFMDRIRPIGGSDLLKALQAVPADREIIYVGKGAPSFGETETSKILEAMKGRRIRTIAVGSDANLGLLEKLGGLMQVSPNDDVPKRVAEIAATLGSPRVFDLRIESEAIQDVVGLRDLFYGERMVAAGRYRGTSAKLTISGSGYRREVDVAFPAKEEGNNYVRRLWAQRKVSDLLAQGPAKKAEVTELGVKYQIMTPFTSFLVLENEQMWKDHQLKREVQKQDQVLGKGEAEKAAQELARPKTEEAQKAVIGAAPGARKIAEESRDDFRLRIEQCQIEILKHVRDGERYLNARMYGEARKEFENAEFKIQNIPYEVRDLQELLPLVKDEIVKVRNNQIIEDLRTEELKRRSTEAEAAAHEIPTKRAVTRKIAQLLELSYMAVDQKRYDKCIKLCDEILQIDPNYPVARELREDAEKTRHKDGYYDLLSRKVEQWKRLTDDEEQAVVPLSQSLRFPSREEWAEVSKRLTESVIKTEGGAADEESAARLAKTPANGSEWEELLNKLKSNYAVTEQQKASQADEHYRLADRYFVAGDFEKSVLEAQKALQLSPNHAPARALHMENQFILGQGKATPSTADYDKFLNEALVRHQQTLVEIDNAYERGKRSYNQGDMAQAEREFRKVTEFAKWMPIGVEVEYRRKAALDMLQRAQAGGRQTEIDGEKARLRLVEEEGARKDFRAVAPPDRGVLFDQALKRFEGEDFRGAVEDADRLLRQNPNDVAVLEMRNLAQRFQHMKRGSDVNLRQLTNEWRRPYEPVELNAAIQSDSVELPALKPPPIFTVTTSVTAPGAPVADPLPIMSDLPLAGQLFASPESPEELRRKIQSADADLTRSQADLQTFVRQLEVQLAQVQELTTKVGMQRRVTGPGNTESLVDLQKAREQAGRLQRDLAELEEKHVNLARDKKRNEETLNAIAQAGGNVNVAPKKALECKVTAIAPEIGLVVISIGKDDGVLEGDEFTVYRGGDFVAKIVIDRSDRKWAAGKIVLKKQEPRINDDVSNHIFVSADGKKITPERITPDQASYENVQRIRAKMGMKE